MACRAYVYVLPTLRFYGHFLWVPANTQKVARFAACADSRGARISPQVDVRTVKNPKMSSKRRTDLKIWPPKAKNLEELDFDISKSLAPRKSAENDEKPKNKSEMFSEEKKFGVEKSKFANLPKRALPKFRGDRSQVRGVNWRSKFRAIYSFEPSIGCRREAVCSMVA